jgi:hypothetical protein
MRYLSIWGTLIVLLIALGCSGGSPVSPGNSLAIDPGKTLTSIGNNHVLWGMWDISIDPATMTAQATPLRGVEFTCNVTQFMQKPISPVNMIQLSIGSGSDPSSGYFEVLVTLKHPFPGLNQYGGFDVRGIFMSDGSVSGTYDSTVLRAGADDSHLINADGYTRFWNYPEFTSYNSIFGFTSGKLGPPNHPMSTVNPYKYFADGLDKDSPVTSIDPSSRGMFKTTPGANTRQYDIQFKMNSGNTVFDFQYAVDASWDQPDPSFAPEYPQEAFSASANCQEAFAISVSDAGSTAFYVSPTENGGELVLGVEVYDWQAMTKGASVPDEISAIWVESPVLGSPINLLDSAIILPGSSIVSSVFETTIGTLNLTKSGEEDLFITVESKSPDTYEPQLPGGSTFSYPFASLAAYLDGSVTIGDTSAATTPTVLSIDPNWGYKDKTLTGVTITGTDFDPAASVELEYAPGDTLSVSNIVVVDPTTITFDLDMTDATLGLYDVNVVNPLAAPGVLPDGFEVKLFQAIWPVTQGNPQHTGTIGFNGPNGPTGGSSFSPSWNYTYSDASKGNAVSTFLNDTTAFFSIAFNYLDTNHLPAMAVDLATHTVKWTKVINTTSHSSVVVLGINADGTIVLVWDWPSSDIYGLDADDGSILWGPMVGGISSSDTYATLDNNGNFIIAAPDGIRSIVPSTGTLNWTAAVNSPGYCTPAVGPDGTIYAYSNWLTNAQLNAIDPATGDIKWTTSGMARCDNGVVYNPVTNTIIVNAQGGLFCWKDNGSSASQVWVQSYPYPWFCSSAVAPNGDIYLVDGSGTLRRLDPDTGATLNSSTGWGTGYGSRPAIGDNGLVYVNHDTYFKCANADCTLRWSFYVDVYAGFGAPAIGQDGTVYAARRTNGLCAWHD